ncbi:hypothetical protein KC726_06275, partial [Candidatus Woesebacteria bacterium]|nr:hypothetical protein [Candidatus Woesebacteria bacterium]
MAAPSTSKKELLSILPPQILASPRVVTAMAIAEDAHGEQLRDTGETYLEGHIWLLAMQVYEHYTSAGNLEQLL